MTESQRYHAVRHIPQLITLIMMSIKCANLLAKDGQYKKWTTEIMENLQNALKDGYSLPGKIIEHCKPTQAFHYSNCVIL